MIRDLFAHNDWANAKILKLCAGLADGQLDQEAPIGFGSLRATLFHMWAAEQLWFDRWIGEPWKPLDTNAGGVTVEQLSERFADIAAKRNRLIKDESSDGFTRVVDYRNTQGHDFQHVLGELLMHVANHATHHRAQALNYLKQFDRTVPAGLDYIFYKLAYPTIDQLPESVEAMRAFGLEVAAGDGRIVDFELQRIQRYYAYSDWATSQLLASAADLADEVLDQNFDMGPGTFRRTILHTVVAEEWWYRNWTAGPSAFGSFDEPVSVEELRNRIAVLTEQRNEFVASLDPESATREITISAGGGPPTKFRVLESMIQMCSHGTHHRAQLLNMLRRLGAATPAIDYVVWLRATG